MTEDADDGLDTVVAEFTCPSEQANQPNNPVEQLTGAFRKAGLRFAVEEYRISREEILVDPDWEDWRESHQGEIPSEVATFVFLCSEQDQPAFCRIFEQWTETKERSI